MTKINSRQKGARIEREAAEFLRGFGFTVERNARNGKSAADLDLSAAPVLARLHIEVKGDQSIDVHTDALVKAWDQADDCRKPEQFPVVLWKKDRAGWRLTYRVVGASEVQVILATVRADSIAATLRWLAK